MALFKKCAPQNCVVTISCTDVIECVTTELTKIIGDQSTSLSNFCEAVAFCVDAQLQAISDGESNDLTYFGLAITKILQSQDGYSDTGELFLKIVDGTIIWTESSADSFFIEEGTGIDITGAGTSINPAIVNCTITQYTDEMAQDAFGVMLLDTDTAELTYTDATPSFKVDVIVGEEDNDLTDLVVWTGTEFKTRTLESLNIPETTYENGIYYEGGIAKLGGALTEDTVIGDIETETNTFGIWAKSISLSALDGSISLSTTGSDSILISTGELFINDALTQDDTQEKTLVWDSSDGKVYWRDIASISGTVYTNEMAQDTVGGILTDTATIDFTYNDGAGTITADVKDDSITDAKLRESVEYSVIGKATAGTGNPTDIAAGTDSVLRRNGSGDLAFGTLVTANIGDDQVTFAKTQNINTQRILGRSTAGSGDIESLTLGSHLKLATGVLNTYGRTLIGISVFNASGVWGKPTGCNAALIYVIGAGGGGGGSDASASEASTAGGGGAGGFAIHYAETGLGVTETVTIGTGGTAGTAGNDGGDGGDSSFGTHTDATGGFGGKAMTSGTTNEVAVGGSGGSGTGNILSASGQVGRSGLRLGIALNQNNAGRGGISFFGEYGGDEKGAGGPGSTSINGTTSAGTAGEDGIIIVYELS
jgi:hypothetical protein